MKIGCNRTREWRRWRRRWHWQRREGSQLSVLSLQIKPDRERRMEETMTESISIIPDAAEPARMASDQNQEERAVLITCPLCGFATSQQDRFCRRCGFNLEQERSAAAVSPTIPIDSRQSKTLGSNHFDLVVIGSGPAGQKGAIDAAKHGKGVAIIDRREMIGGMSLHTGTIPSKTLREAVIYLTGYRQRAFYGRDYKLKQEISVTDLMERVNTVVAREMAVIRDQLARNGVTTIDGTARFTRPHTLEVEGRQGVQSVEADYVLIACGSRAARPPEIPFGNGVMDADQIGQASSIPRDFIVVGAGVVGLESGKRLHAEGLLYAVGRQANTDLLNLSAADLEADGRGRIPVNEHFQSAVNHIYAAGDCIGFPALAATSMEQGRLAVHHMFGRPSTSNQSLFPHGIYTIPEISMIGQTEQELTSAGIPYEIGVARYEEIAKGQIVGDDTGMLKLLFHPETLKVLGVHAIGENATEIIHIGQMLMALDGTIEFFRDSVFNYPSFAEAYKVAALNGLNKL